MTYEKCFLELDAQYIIYYMMKEIPKWEDWIMEETLDGREKKWEKVFLA